MEVAVVKMLSRPELISVLCTGIGTLLAIATIYIRASMLHARPASVIHHQSINHDERKALVGSGKLTNLPTNLLKEPEDFKVIHELDQWVIRRTTLRNGEEFNRAFTRLMRRNMGLFARFPQCWLIRLVARNAEQRQSFSQEHIKSLDFEDGDLFCGIYRVVRRSQCHMEANLEMPRSKPPVGGMLVVSMVTRDDQYLLSTQTIQ